MYFTFVVSHPFIAAMIQFALLGTLGEVMAQWFIKRKICVPFSLKLLCWKMVVWAILAIAIKTAFVGFNGFVDGVATYGLLPDMAFIPGSWTRAFFISLFMNLQFGPFLVIAHRLLDLVLEREKGFKKLDKALLSLLWFWIPAHTLTFVLPKDYQITLAALWSVVLGILLGYFSLKSKP